MMAVNECLKNVRYQLGLSQREFADLLGVNKASISLYEIGVRQPSFPTIRKIVNELKKHNIQLKYSDLRNDK